MNLNQKRRNENEVFNELEKLCSSPGYIHIIAYFCFRDNTIQYANRVQLGDILRQFSVDRLIRTEISTLIGLTCKNNIDETIPSPEILQEYIEKTDSLLKELHESMLPPVEEFFDKEKINDHNYNPFTNGKGLRESIFYGGESAYHFQYRDLSEKKYIKDDSWFIRNKGYSLSQLISVLKSIQETQNQKINDIFFSFPEKLIEEWSFLDAFIFTVDEISNNAKINPEITLKIVESFSFRGKEKDFNALDEFNPTNAYPIIPLKNALYLLLQNYSLFEAVYETPFFWFLDDNSYKDIAMEHRGSFTEEFAFERLKRVFGENLVFKNIDIFDSKKKVGEIDVLVVFAGRAIVLQAKSKKLTIEARKGNDLSLRNDFKKAIQDSYDQAFDCSIFLSDSQYKLFSADGMELKIYRKFEEIYPVCLVSDHYPALTFQSTQFLQQNKSVLIKPAFIMDVFFLDVLSELLSSPLYFLSYINRRTLYNQKIISTHELTILAYHLKQNLYLENDNEIMHLADDLCASINLAMLSRRDNIPGEKTLDGILTRFHGTHFEKIIKEIEQQNQSSIIDLGFILLTLSEETVKTFNDGISKLIELVNNDGQHHDLTILISDHQEGLTIHCNMDSNHQALKRLDDHCERRKYKHKANRWFGICISPKGPKATQPATSRHLVVL